MSFSCEPDPTFGQAGTLWSEMPTPLTTQSGTANPAPAFVGGTVNALWSMGQPPRPVLLVSSWDPAIPGGVNWRVLRLVAFPADGRPMEMGRWDGTVHMFLSEFTKDCDYLDSALLDPSLLLILLREQSGRPGPWSYLLRRATVMLGSVRGVTTNDVQLSASWLYEPSDVYPQGNARLQQNQTNPSEVAIVSTRGGALRATVLTLSQPVQAVTTNLASILPAGAADPFNRLRVESLRFVGRMISVAMTGWRASGRSQGLILRFAFTGTALTRDSSYGADGLWQSVLPGIFTFRLVREWAGGVIGTAERKLVALGVQPDGQDLDVGFGVGGVCELDLGGSLRDSAAAGEDRDGWLCLFAQRQDGATVGARVRVDTLQRPAPNGTIDPSFGSSGVQTISIDGYPTRPVGVAFTDPSYVHLTLGRGLPSGIGMAGVARVRLSNGALDPAFGSRGVARHEGMSGASAFYGDGRCVYATSRRSDNTLTLSWLDASGRFARASTSSHTVSSSEARSILLHPDGSIWAAGSGAAPWVARFTSAGALDGGFGTGGFAKLRETEGQGNARLIGTRPDGSVLGLATNAQGSFLFALSPTGQPDSGYGQGGFTKLPTHSAFAFNSGYRARSDGSVLFTTSTIHDPRSFGSPMVHVGVVRVRADGTLDPTFGLAAQSPVQAPVSRRCIVTLQVPTTASEVMECRLASIIEQGGKLYGIGTADVGAGSPGGQFSFPVYHFIVVTRWNQDGSLDTTFGRSGVALHGESSGLWLDWSCTAVATEPSGEMTLAGASGTEPAIWRLTSSGDLDRGFFVCSVRLQEVAQDAALGIVLLAAGKVRLSCSTGLVQLALKPTLLRVFVEVLELVRRGVDGILRALGLVDGRPVAGGRTGPSSIRPSADA